MKMRLDLGIMAGDNTKKFLGDLSAIVERFEKAADRLSSKNGTAPAETEEEETPEETETDFMAAEEEAPAPAPARRGRPPKAKTADDVNDACKAALLVFGGDKAARAKVLGVLGKFKVKSVTELKAEQYPAVISALKAASDAHAAAGGETEE